MRRTLLIGLSGAALVCCAPAAAQPVIVLDGSRVVTRDEPLGPLADLPPGPPATASSARTASSRRARGVARARAATSARHSAAAAALRRLRARGAISAADYAHYAGSLAGARAALRRLSGTRHAELASVLGLVDGIAARGSLTASRLRPVFLTLDRNVQWWTQGRLLSDGDRVSFAGSQIVFQYYAGYGLQLQMLGNWGKVNALYFSSQDTALRGLVNELVPLAAQRGGAIAWEYYFTFDGGTPPWTSGLSQGTAVEGLARSAQELSDPSLEAVMRKALGLFTQPAPVGVKDARPHGNHYLIYSFAPHYHVINAFIQALNGLWDSQALTGDARAKRLFHLGDLEARYELPYYDLGDWTRYSNASEQSTPSYGGLLRDFLRGLCERTGTREYCRYADRFSRYLIGRLGHDLPSQTTGVRKATPAPGPTPPGPTSPGPGSSPGGGATPGGPRAAPRAAGASG